MAIHLPAALPSCAHPVGRLVRGPGSRQRGFTLIELVMVIVIVAVLAAVAIPKFIDLRSDARIATVRSLDGAIRTNAEIWHIYCITRQPCGSTAGFYHLSYGGKTHLIQNAYPEAGDVVGGDQMDNMLTLHSFDVSLVNNLTTRFAAQGAPDPSSCAVTYQQAAALGQAPVITMSISGC